MSTSVYTCEGGIAGLLRPGFRMVVYALLLGGLAAGMLQGVVVFGPEFYSETGPVEILQSVFALTAALFLLLSARVDSARTPFAVLTSGVLFCFVTRESDYILDLLISRHAWKAGVFVILIFTGGYAWRVRKKIPASLCQFANHPSSGIFLSGLLVLLVFSRVFGCGYFWEGIVIDWKWAHVKELVRQHTNDITYTLLIEDKCLTIKRVVEESTEQIGYFLMTVASFEYWIDARETARCNQGDNG